MDMPYSHLFLMALVRGLLVVGAMLAIGAPGFYWLVLSPALSSMKGKGMGPAGRRGEFSAGRLAAWAVALLAAANVMALIHEGAMMSGRPVLDVVSVLPAVLTQTHWGAVWIARSALIAALAVVLVIRLPMPAVLFISAGAAATISLASHAVDAGNISLPVVADSVHIISISFWLGGLAAFRTLAPREAGMFAGTEDRRRFLYEVLRRFSRLATVSVALAVATGVYAASLHAPGFISTTQATAYGKVLRAKHVFAIATIAMGGVSRFFVLPGLGKSGSGDRVSRLLWIAITIELVLAAATLASASVLTQETPPFLG